MRPPDGIAGGVVRGAAVLLVLVQDRLVAWAAQGVRRVNALGPLHRLRAWLGRQPPARALLMFLVPEVTSRSGTAVSAWLLIEGHARQAVAVYAASKLFAGVLALWVYSACEPALLRVRWFAWLHAGVVRWRGWALRRLRGPAPGRLARAVAQVRARNAASGLAPATASPPTVPDRTE